MQSPKKLIELFGYVGLTNRELEIVCSAHNLDVALSRYLTFFVIAFR
jgi:hypothetical protein